MSDDNKPFSVRMGIVPVRSVHSDGWDETTLLRLKDLAASFLTETNAEKLLKKTFGTDHRFANRGLFAHHGEELVSVTHGNVQEDPGYWWPRIAADVLTEAANQHMWAALLNFIEFAVASEWDGWDNDNAERMIAETNEVLHWVRGYRMRNNGKIAPLFTPEETAAVEASIKGTSAAVRNQMDKAVTLFSDRKNPDYGAAVQQAIHAAWAAMQICTGESQFKVGVRKLRESGKLHPTLAAAFGNLFGFTSQDGKGMRHPEFDGELPPDMTTARFVIATCASFINHMAESHPDKFAPPKPKSENGRGGHDDISEDIPF